MTKNRSKGDGKSTLRRHEMKIKHKNKMATIDIQQNQMNTEWGSGNTGTKRA